MTRIKIMHWIAISSFAAYLVHCDVHFCDSIYIKIIGKWYNEETTLPFLLYNGIWIIGIFAVSILIDKVRIAI